MQKFFFQFSVVEVNEMLLRLYYLYRKSPKKSRELESIAEDLRVSKGGNLPINAREHAGYTTKEEHSSGLLIAMEHT